MHCFVKFTLANYQGHKCEKKLESGELLAGQVEEHAEGEVQVVGLAQARLVPQPDQ